MFESRLRCKGHALHFHCSSFGIFLLGLRKCVWGMDHPVLVLPTRAGTCLSRENGVGTGALLPPITPGVFGFNCVSESLGGPTPRVDLVYLGWAWEFSCLTNFQVMLMLSGPHLENHSPTAAFQVLSRGGSQLDVYSTLVSVSLSPWTSFFFSNSSSSPADFLSIPYPKCSHCHFYVLSSFCACQKTFFSLFFLFIFFPFSKAHNKSWLLWPAPALIFCFFSLSSGFCGL